MLLSNAICIGRSSVGVLSNSCTEIECFAVTATTNLSLHFYHSVLGGDSAVSQNADGLLEVASSGLTARVHIVSQRPVVVSR